MFKRIFVKVFWVVTIGILRYITHSTISIRNVTNRQKKKYKEIVKTMEFLEETLLDFKLLNNDYTEGPEPVNTKAARRVQSAFVSQRDKREEQDFYLYVAKAWVKDLDRISIRNSIIFLFLIFTLIFTVMVLTLIIGPIAGTPALLLIAVVLLFSLLGLVNALRGKGWKKWTMLGLHLLVLYVFLHLYMGG